MGGLKTGWVDFRYERLPIFYYWCGKIDHDDRDCPLWINSKESLGSEDRQFGPWLRADSKRLQQPMVAEVDKRKPSGCNGEEKVVDEPVSSLGQALNLGQRQQQGVIVGKPFHRERILTELWIWKWRILRRKDLA
ncbi:hypothetical protein CFP56_002186 [Quercus suber]|uniref:Zinc knuckle CX2CX4HX4C domain-containing protein n=1 Tax=Quercus suber TaxID=58331 RepID=A0AAW0M8Q4_QUESU